MAEGINAQQLSGELPSLTKSDLENVLLSSWTGRGVAFTFTGDIDVIENLLVSENDGFVQEGV